MNFLKKIILVIALIFPVLTGAALADGVNWSDASQIFDDNINGSNVEYPLLSGATGTSTYVSPNIEQCSGSNAFCQINTSIVTPSTLVWTERFRAYVPNSQFYPFLWNYPGSSNSNYIYCLSTGICNGINAVVSNSTPIVTASTALPSTCYSTSAVPSTWCWAKLIRNGTTATFYVASDNNGQPGTYVQYLTSNNFSSSTGSNFAFGSINGTIQIGGNYPCVNHISSNIAYNCNQFADQYMMFNDNFWGSAAYTLSGNAVVSSNTLNIGANTDSQNDGAYFKPFGTITKGQNFAWEYRVNSNNSNNALLTNIFANSPTAGICPQAALQLIQQISGNYNLRYTGNACGSASTITNGLANPTIPYYVKLVYNAPNLTVYYATVTAGNTYSSLTWNILIPSTNLSSYLGNSSTFSSNNLGSYFGFTAVNTIASIGGSNKYTCPNYVSSNSGWDCFNQAIYTHNSKSYKYAGSSNTIFDTFQNSTDSNVTLSPTGGSTIGSGQFAWTTSSTSSPYGALYNGTLGWNNSTAFTRVSFNSGGVMSVGMHTTAPASFACYAYVYNNELSVQNYVSGSNNTNYYGYSPYIKSGIPYYLYYYINGSTQTAILYNELSSGVPGNIIATATGPCTAGSVGSGYVQLYNGQTSVAGSYGGTGSTSYPLILRNYATSTPPPVPQLGYLQGFTQNFSDGGVFNLSPYTVFMNTPNITSNGYTDPSNSGNRYGLEPTGFTGQNKAAVMRFNPNGCALSTCTGSLYLAYTSDSNLLNIAMNGGNLILQNNGSTVASVSPPSTSTGAYDIFGSNDGINFYGQACGESSTGVPNFNSCTSVISASDSGVTIVGTPIIYVLNANSSPGSTTYMGGAYPYLQVRDYGDGPVPTTLSQFLRGY